MAGVHVDSVSTEDVFQFLIKESTLQILTEAVEFSLHLEILLSTLLTLKESVQMTTSRVFTK